MQGKLSTFSAWRWRVFAATWLCYGGFYFARKPFFIVKSDLGDRLGLSATDLGNIGFAYLLAYTIGQFVAGALGQRFGSRKLLIAGMAAAVAASVGFGLAGGLISLSLLMVVNGLAQATGWSGTVGNMAQWFRRNERGRVMGVWATCYQVGGVAANAMAAFILVRWGDRVAFFAGALVLAGVLAFFLANQADKPSDKGFADLPPDSEAEAKAEAEAEADAESAGRGKGPGWSRATWISVLLVGSFYFFVKFIRYALWSWAPYLLKRNFGLEGDDAGYVSTIFDLCGIAGVILAGWLSDRYFSGRRAGISLILLLGMVGATGLLATAGASSLTAFSIAIGLIGLCLYGPDALMTGAGAMDIGSRRGAILAAGIINGMGSAGSIVQEVVIGRLYDSSSGDVAGVLSLLLGASLGAVFFLAVVVQRNRMGLSDA
ncbi:MAG: MFS transporter [Deltaproteobacteria bacterium]|nr:MFS transporter [Deltaproteobacteria bacterium]